MRILLLLLCALSVPLEVQATGYLSCLERLFFDSSDRAELSLDQELWVVIRVLGDCTTERQVKLSKSWSGEVTAKILRPRRQSIDDQLEELSKRFPKADLQDLCARVELEELVAEQPTAPPLPELVSRLGTLEFSPVFEPVIYIHGVDYEVWVRSSTNMSFFQFEGPPYRKLARTEGVHPLEAWVREVLEAVGVSCKMMDNSISRLPVHDGERPSAP